MRVLQFVVARHRHLGVVVDGMVADIAGVLEAAVLTARGFHGGSAARLARNLAPDEIADFLALGEAALDGARSVVAHVTRATAAQRAELVRAGVLHRLAEVTFAPPVSPTSALYCAGLNYRDHVAEQPDRAVSDYPTMFLRVVDSFVGHREPLIRPTGVSTAFDFEAELAVVIGRPAHRVAAGDALAHVAGYTILNDGSLRDFQKRGPELTPGKNFYHSGSLGPWLVTADEIGDPQDLSFRTTLSGEVMQSSNTQLMIFDVATLIALVSEFARLQPGDLIATGTPAGVGFRRVPPRFMRAGERLAIEFDRIGRLENPVIDEDVA